MIRHSSRRVAGLIALAAIVVVIVAVVARPDVVPISLAENGATKGPQFVYREFGADADILWLAQANAPTSRSRIATIPHAYEWGSFATLSPDGKTIAYTAIDPGAGNVTSAVPADLWFVDSTGKNQRRVATGIDLRVSPVWATDSKSVAVRRAPNVGRYELISVSTDGKTQSLASVAASVFPVGFSSSSETLYYVQLGPTGTDLIGITASGAGPAVRLTDGPTREWKLSPDGGLITYLAHEFNDGGLQFKAKVSKIDGTPIPISIDGNHLSPVWRPDGRAITFSAAGGIVTLEPLSGETKSEVQKPRDGFDAPVGWSTDTSLLALRHFDGTSMQDPGRQSLLIMNPVGVRFAVGGTSETEFIGWMVP